MHWRFYKKLPPTLEETCAPARRRPATRIHLPWALDHLTEPTGYIPATAQETLLHTFLGDRLAAQAALLADRWRQPMPALVPSQPSHTPPQQADRQTPNATPLSIPTGPQPTMLNPAAETQQQPTPPDHPPSPSSSSSTASTNSTTSTSSTSSTPRAPPAPHQQPQQFRQALESLDQVDLDTVLKQKFFGFQSPPPFLRGRIRQALATALDAINAAETEQQTVRAWKLCSCCRGCSYTDSQAPERCPNQSGMPGSRRSSLANG